MKKIIIGLAIIAIFAAFLYARPIILGSDDFFKNTELTIYNQGIGLVKQEFSTDLVLGTNDILVEGVASQIDTSSVKLNGGIELLEQNYQYDLVNRDQMLKKFIGKEVTVILKDPREEIDGTLLSYSGGTAIIQDRNGKMNILSAEDFILPQMDTTELLLKPTLQWIVNAPKAMKYDLTMMYLTRGMTWTADYILELNPADTAAGLKGWVTIDNTAGTTFKDAKLKLMAGDVNVEDDYSYERSASGGAVSPSFQEESMFEYHMYTLERPTTLKDKEEKQISLLEAEGVNVEKRFVYPSSGSKVDVKIIFSNSEKNNMGMALPKGKVKVFKNDNSGSLQFIGEDSIDHTPKDEEIELSIGQAFDIVAEKKQTGYQEGKPWRQYSYDLTFRNHKAEAASIYAYEYTSYWSEWSIISETMPHVKEDQGRIYWKVDVPANGNATVSYTLKYTYRGW